MQDDYSVAEMEDDVKKVNDILDKLKEQASKQPVTTGYTKSD